MNFSYKITKQLQTCFRILNTICNLRSTYSCLFERFRFINYKTFLRMKVINFCKEVNLAVSLNL